MLLLLLLLLLAVHPADYRIVSMGMQESHHPTPGPQITCENKT
jgi:hypothetical protein